mmetsp:Transcript_14990/g.44932  ORF Transcript_14990/g.44932 Transcript_14990/m.44932 type:complete len:223 (+) Transcript_14990:4112-4780(+)
MVELVAHVPVLWAPRIGILALVAVRHREDLRRLVPLGELEPVVKEVHPHQRANVEHEEEQDEPVLERLACRNHGLEQDLQRRGTRGELVQHAEETQGSKRLQTSGAASVQGDDLLDHRDDDHHAVEAGGGVLEVPHYAAGEELQDHLHDEDEEEDVSDVLLGRLQGHVRRKLLHHHEDHVARDDEHDEGSEGVVAGNDPRAADGRDVQPGHLVKPVIVLVVV